MMKKTTYAWRKKVSFFIKLHSKLAAFSPFVRIPSMITKKSSPWNKVRESLSPCPCITPKFCIQLVWSLPIVFKIYLFTASLNSIWNPFPCHLSATVTVLFVTPSTAEDGTAGSHITKLIGLAMVKKRHHFSTSHKQLQQNLHSYL